MPDSPPIRPIIGITADSSGGKCIVGRTYTDMVTAAGGLPMILPCISSCAEQFIDVCDAIVFTGGDDPIMTHWQVPMHAKARPMSLERQEFELALFKALEPRPDKAVLGICLGMQLMGLQAGGKLDQHLADTLPTAGQHWDNSGHEVSGELGTGTVHSHHRQALTDPGTLRVIARASDGVIEAVRRDDRPFYIGVQWHPERTTDQRLGLNVIRRLVDAARSNTSHP